MLLLLPLAAMQFTQEVAWGAPDFIVLGSMLAAACLTVELAAWATGNSAYRAAVGVAVAAAFLLIWVNLAVGFLGSEDNDANLIFGGVLAVAIAGAIVARFQAAGMAKAMSAAAAQILVGIVALAAGWASAGPDGLYEVGIGSGFFAALWLLSAWLFQRAAREQGVASSHGGR